jgi:hypothetical protein
MTRRPFIVSVLAAASIVALPAIASLHDPVISSNEPLPFPQNGQNEPALALDRDPKHRGPLLIAGGNDYRDQSVCVDPAHCAFSHYIGISGLYYSDDGSTFIRSSYARPAGSIAGPSVIRTLPNFSPKMWSFGDPSLGAGPRRRIDNTFTWSLGTRFYYATLAALAYQPPAPANHARVITVSYSDPKRFAGRAQPTWSRPKRVSTGILSDKPAIWADDAALSAHGKPNPNFGHVYLCWTVFSANEEEAGGQIMFARSVDGGFSWSAPLQVSTGIQPQAQGCTIRSDAAGRVYVFWRERTPRPQDIRGPTGTACAKLFQSSIQMAQSSDGLVFTAPAVVAGVLEPGFWDRTQGQCTADGVAGARINSLPNVDIANGAPGGAGPNTFALATNEGPSDRVVIRTSHDLGLTWSPSLPASRPGDNPAFPAVALAPAGNRIFLVYTAFLQKWQKDTAQPRPMRAVVRTVLLTSLERGAPHWAEVEGASGDARASAGFEGGDADANPVRAEFLGDYNAIVATNVGANAAWTDVSAAVDCGAVDRYRQSVANGKEQPFPNLRKSCRPGKGVGGLKTTFGNTTLCGIFVPARLTPGTRETKCSSDLHP